MFGEGAIFGAALGAEIQRREAARQQRLGGGLSPLSYHSGQQMHTLNLQGAGQAMAVASSGIIAGIAMQEAALRERERLLTSRLNKPLSKKEIWNRSYDEMVRLCNINERHNIDNNELLIKDHKKYIKTRNMYTIEFKEYE